MSSRLIPPKVGSSGDDLDDLVGIRLAQLDVEHVDVGELLEEAALPSMTGFAASGPIWPSPRTAVPLETTATRLAREVSAAASSGSSAMARQA